MPESEENVIINLRSVLLATMGGIPINKVEGKISNLLIKKIINVGVSEFASIIFDFR